jgi:arylsulfatase
LSSPFQGTKQDASHLGGTTDPLVISWPGHIKDAGRVRSQFSHVNDIASTIYDIIGITPPAEVNGVAQIPLEGTSLAYTFDHPKAPTRHTLQYFATSGNRAIYKDGWWAGDRYRSTWERGPLLNTSDNPNVHPWELYNLNEDYSQAHDLAAKYPEKLKELQQIFLSEATRNQVYPLFPQRAYYPGGPAMGKKVFTYRSGVTRLPWPVAPALYGRAYTITADVEVPETGGDGAIFAQGGNQGGVTLFVKNRHVVYEVNAYNQRAGQLVSSDPLQPGKAHIVLNLILSPGEVGQIDAFAYTLRRPVAGVGQLSINGRAQGEAQFANVNASLNETLDIGCDLGSPVSHDYKPPNCFSGKIDKVVIELK